uniref:Pyrin domain-containing protein n=1 Tax=Dicentrarchus labrax TaxID=13489 RepID=A0A8P4K214_DICLA
MADLLITLEDLTADEFKTFKWYLRLEGNKSIKRSKLEGAERRDTVDLMVNTYTPHGALKVTMKILKKISRNDLVQSLSDTCSGPEGQSHLFLLFVSSDKKSGLATQHL